MERKAAEDEARASSPMRREVFVGGLAAAGASAADLIEMFGGHGIIVKCHLPNTNKDIGFVEFATSSEAAAAIAQCDSGLWHNGQALRVNLSKPKVGEVQGSAKFPGQEMTQQERIATYGVGTGYINYAYDRDMSKNRPKRKDGYIDGDQRIKFDRSMIPRQ